MNENVYNNWGICSLGIMVSLRYARRMSIVNSMLIAPIVFHDGLLRYLARATTSVTSIEQLIVRDATYFSNYNSLFYSGLVPSINALQFLVETEIVKLDGGNIELLEFIEYDRKMGQRAGIIYRAAENVGKLVVLNSSTLYSNLRIEL